MNFYAFEMCVGYNMWYDEYSTYNTNENDPKYRDFLYFDKKVWDNLTKELPKCGYNAIIIDLAEGVEYSCAPELKVKGTIARNEFKQMLTELKNLGLEPIPKLDFSASHDIWLKTYSRMLGTEEYRDYVKKLIDDVCDLFDKPKYFHIGMGDEYNEYQEYYGYIVTRGEQAFWRDANAMFKACEDNGATPIISGEYFLRFPEVFDYYIPENVIIDAHYQGIIAPEKDLFGRDIRSSQQIMLEKLCERQNKILLSSGRTGWDEGASGFFKFAKGKNNILGIISQPMLATVEENELSLLCEMTLFRDTKKQFE